MSYFDSDFCECLFSYEYAYFLRFSDGSVLRSSAARR